MSKIRSKNTKPEMLVRKFLFTHGYRYRLHVKELFGKPDIVLKRYRIAIFINGCFWHQHSKCKYSKMPTSNEEYWIPKLRSNVLKDRKTVRELKKINWMAITIWECQLKTAKSDKTLNELLSLLEKRKSMLF